ncbi:MAG: GNAT family N-acetyltransferase [Treponema sp.]|jgi:Leu/Phe-tRNA-protein transferase|nr:GNAT family N-acetyltransferase [Treponema sp.]
MYLRYTLSGHVFISPEDNLDRLVDALLTVGYGEEFCLALDFDPVFIAGLMAAGFLVMSIGQDRGNPEDKGEGSDFLLLPKLHLTRSVLFFPDLHIKKSLKPLLPRYELRVDTDFDFIVNRCIEIHGADWLTKPLVESIKIIRSTAPHFSLSWPYPFPPVRPVSFGVYRNGALKAGEFGILTGGVYTSYSGYYDEDSTGTVQLVLMTQYLRDRGCAFLDLGMPLDYKRTLGATNIDPKRFVKMFREGRRNSPGAFPV